MSVKTIEAFKKYYKRNTILHKEFDDVDDLYTGFRDGYLLAKKEDEEKIEKLKKALEFYANDENWHVITIEDDSEDTTCLCTISIKDNEERFSYEGMAGGRLARKVLKEIEG